MTNKFDRIQENANKKYIVRNCPCYVQYENSLHLCCDGQGDGECQDCTDCVMKCIKYKLDYLKCYINNDNLANSSKMNKIIDSTLQLLDIQEVE